MNEVSVDASKAAMQLWCNFFHHTTDQHRCNVIQLTDPDFIEMLDDSSNFDEEEFESLFGKSFLFRLVKEAEDEEALNHSSGPSQRKYMPSEKN